MTGDSTADCTKAAIEEAARAVAARGGTGRRYARDEVNRPTARTWLEAIGDESPAYDEVAPPAMAQVWTMYGLRGERPEDDPLGAMVAVLDEAGYTSVVATNSNQTYHRYLRYGEQVSVTSRLDSVVGPKATALGDGWFVTTRSTWWVDDEPVAEMLFRVLKFRPRPAAEPPEQQAIRPQVNQDTAFFWEGTARNELRIQKCGGCGELRHPPGPMCPSCHETKPEHTVASGLGEVYSYVVHHHPPVPGRTTPYVVALVELAEGVRVLAELVDVPPDEDRLHEGGRRPHDARLAAEVIAVGDELPPLVLDVTPTFVVATAIATRDYQDVHHDRDLAVARGSKDIFLNILTDTGLVQRFVTDWAGPAALVKQIDIKLGVPCYAYETLTFTGRVTERDNHEYVIAVVGSNSLGDHLTGTVRIEVP
jgi:uncharacterized OB-fold protein